MLFTNPTFLHQGPQINMGGRIHRSACASHTLMLWILQVSRDEQPCQVAVVRCQDKGNDVCRYLSTHRYNISLMHLVDQIASPYPKALMEQRTSLNLDAWPTPSDYYYNIREGKVSCCQFADKCIELLLHVRRNAV